MAPQIPPLLSPYIALPAETSLILLTGVLGASTNWLVQRYLCGALQPASGSSSSSSAASGAAQDIGGVNDGAKDTKVLLVSFMRDLAFWKDGARKLGVDVAKLLTTRRFAFVDGLSELYLPQQKKGTAATGVTTLQGTDLGQMSEKMLSAVQYLGSGNVVLIVDQLDVFLATAGDSVSAAAVGDMILQLRQHVHSTILTLSADTALVMEQHTPLETNHASLLLDIAHQADLTLSLRLLDTGTARDVSGVIRITSSVKEDDPESSEVLEDREMLYHVGGDGSVKVFERGQ